MVKMKILPIQEELYRLMDSFLVESDKPRLVEQLNDDRHSFMDDLTDLIDAKFILRQEHEQKIEQAIEEERKKYVELLQIEREIIRMELAIRYNFCSEKEVAGFHKHVREMQELKSKFLGKDE